jgi:alkylation response protein AidB-like acyl-CoA dehydrogenase
MTSDVSAVDRLDLPTDLPDDRLAATVDAWLRENLPADWLAAADAGRWAEVEAVLADPERAGAWYDLLGDSGLAVPTWPREQGGLGLPADRAAVVSEQLRRYRAERHNRDFVGLALAGPTILEWGTDEQKAERLPALARARELWCQLFSEPGAGSDLASLSTRAVQREDGSWVVNGQKVWSSYAQYADYAMLLARTDADAPKHRGITYFLLDMRTRGVDPRPLRQMTGDAEFNEVFLDEVVVPDSARLGPVGQGWAVAISTLMQERNGLSGRPAVGEGETERVVAQALATGAWQDPLLRDRLVSAFVDERVLQMATVRSFTETGAEPPTAEGSIRKLAHAVFTESLSRLGSELAPDALAWEPGEMPEAVHQFLAAKTYSIAGGTSEIQRNIIAERLLGLPKDPDPERNLPFSQRGRG